MSINKKRSFSRFFRSLASLELTVIVLLLMAGGPGRGMSRENFKSAGKIWLKIELAQKK
ncbi:MAG: hypothetical protein L6428_11080 [Candidatus Aminicenantes bacterium]|nr:hypothetical protein [Acidobacteriota bacterium]MCG2811980.1 hypothetical protein [Candidatus Aminicenantes bacterium]